MEMNVFTVFFRAEIEIHNVAELFKVFEVALNLVLVVGSVLGPAYKPALAVKQGTDNNSFFGDDRLELLDRTVFFFV